MPINGPDRLHRRPASRARAGRRRRLAVDVAVQGARPARDEQARPDSRDGRRPGRWRRAFAVRSRARGPATRSSARSTGSTGHSQRQWIIDPIDGTKNFVRGVPGVGHPDRARGRRRGRGRRRLRARAAAPLVGLEGRRRLDRPLAAEGDEVRGLRRPPARGRLAVLQLAVRLGPARPAAGLHLALAPLLAHPRLRRLLVLHAARRGHRRPGRRAGARALRHGRARRDRARGRWPFTALDGTDGPYGGNAIASNGHLHDAALAFLGSMPHDDTDPDSRPSGAGSVHDLRSRSRRDDQAALSHGRD